MPPPPAAGRHRRERLHRHRSPHTTLPTVSAALTSERGRTVALSTALSVALVTGVAGGATAATDAKPDHATALWTTELTGTDVFDERDLAPAKWQPRTAEVEPHVTAGISAARVQLKARPVLVLPPAGATWVNPNPAARVTSCFGPRWGRMHEGVDLAAPDHTPIVAAGAGIVVRAGMAQGYGNAVLIDHGDGWLTHYGHLSVITVLVGQHVAAGQQIGDEGSTGHSTGPHLHFEVHQGFYQNPVEPTWWLHQHGVEIPGCDPA